ncbi:MAG: hypothetical protein CBC01_07890 [Betaproteobacteria bacterium TMED41]|mgnify:CR=1 FL=1|nr:MAG: hypothetical protein CBC01_07890 [Betaproteobacteria bacterium TMED41]|tara:strand:- start:2020 stop:3123 length:1104 start_codon:yes stop_codon:yes gene_type:complete
MVDSEKEQSDDEFITPEETNPDGNPSQDQIDAQIKAAEDAASTVSEASEIIKSQEEAYATRRSEEEDRWEAQEAKRAELDEITAKRLETLASTVLDAAEVANRSAGTATSSHKALLSSIKTIQKAAGIGNLRSTIVVSITTALLFATAGLFGLVIYQMNNKIDQLDLMMVNLSTKSAEVKNSLSTVENLSSEIGEIKSGFDLIKKSQITINEKMGELITVTKNDKTEQVKLVQAQTKEATKEGAESVKKMLESVKKLEDGIKKKFELQEKAINSQKKIIASLNKKINSYGGDLKENLKEANKKADELAIAASELTKVRDEIQALITLQQRRYLEAIKAAVPDQKNKQMIKYPGKVSTKNADNEQTVN